MPVVCACPQIKQHHVNKVAIYQDQTMVEVLDCNGIQRAVEIFPQAAPILMDDMREADVYFYVAPPLSREPSMAEHLAIAFATTCAVLLVFKALGVLELAIFGWMVMGEMIMSFARDVAHGAELTLGDLQKEVDRRLGRSKPKQPDAVRVVVEKEHKFAQPEDDSKH
jgi:hypothetical protein